METLYIVAIDTLVVAGIAVLAYTKILRPNLKNQIQREWELRDRESSLAIREEQLHREEEFKAKLRSTELEIEQKHAELVALEAEYEDNILRISQLTPDNARELVIQREAPVALASVEREVAILRQDKIETLQDEVRNLMLQAMQRNTTQYIAEASVSVVTLESEDQKGRLIGREGRNIRAFEQTTGVDLIIDETPGAVVLSCFDPLRREIARMTLEQILVDGRVHPARIEECYGVAKEQVERDLIDAANSAIRTCGISHANEEILAKIGELRYRSSFAQNVLDHSIEVSRLAVILAAELGFDSEIVRRAGLLHDIGKVLSSPYDGPHALAGMRFLADQGESEPVLHAVGAHHHDIPPTTPEAQIIIIADTISASRPGARRESLDSYLKRMSELEKLASDFKGVESCYAVQAGREIRVIVKPEMISDAEASQMVHELSRRIQSEMKYPGPIKITVIRELRVSEVIS